MTAGLRASVPLVMLLAFGLPRAVPVQAMPPQTAKPPAVTYTYDSDGRLLTVTNAAGLTSTYTYDAAGNVLAVSKPAKTAKTAKAASARPGRPGPGPRPDQMSATARAGSLLVVRGKNFSPDPGMDDVNIGSLIAPVLEASSTTLTVRVPPGAGGAVTVRTPAGAAQAGRVTITGGTAMSSTATPTAPVPPRPEATGTALTGLVETAAGSPLSGVHVSIGGQWGDGGTKEAVTDQTGRFTLADITAGRDEITVDATSVHGADYGIYAEPVQVPADQTTVLPWTIYLTPIDTKHAVTVNSPTKRPVVIRNPSLPGVEVLIPVGTVIRGPGGALVHRLSLTKLPLDRTPFPLAPGMPAFFTLQPGNVTFSGKGIQVVYANVTHLPAGATVPYVALNPAWGVDSWYRYGEGKVTADGTQITPDTTTRFQQAMPFGYIPQPTPPTAPPPDGQTGGEPVDLATGLYVMNATDLSLADSQPAILTRTYRDQDDNIRGFGLGTEDGFDWFVTLDPAISGDYALVLPNGSQIDYAPAATAGQWDAVGTPTGFAGSVLTQGVLHVSTFIITLRDGTVYDFGEEQALLDQVSNQYGSALTISRVEKTGQIETVTTPGGKWMQFTYGTCLPATGSGTASADCVTQVTDDAAQTVSYTYDSDARLTGVTDAAGGRTIYTWAPCTSSLTCTELLSIKDPNGNTVLRNVYGPTGSVTSQTIANGGKWHYGYLTTSGYNSQTTVTDPRGNRTVWDFGANGYATSQTQAAGTPDAETTTFSYSPTTNFLKSQTDPLGRTTSYAYDALGNITSVTELSGTPKASTTMYTYEGVHNRIASVTLPGGSKTTWTYDDATRTVTETDGLGNKTVMVLNQEAQPVEITNGLGDRSYLSYFDGDLIADANPDGDVNSVFYDGSGNPLQLTDAEGNTSQTVYNALGEITSSTDPLGHVTRYAYDHDGNLTSVTDPDGHKTTYTYNSMGELTSATDPLGKKTGYTHDVLGNLTATTNRAGTTDTFTYDALGRLAMAVYGASLKTGKVTMSMAYDLGNRLTGISETSVGTYKYRYDGRNDILSASSPQGTVQYTYDEAGRRLTMTASRQSAVTYTYDKDNLVTGISQGSDKITVGYDAGLRVAAITLPGAIKRVNRYDPASNLTGITYTAGTKTIGTLGYAYTLDGQVSAVTGSLASVSMPPPVTSATYNADNELTKENGIAYSYDAQGDLTSANGTSYSWNALGELASASGTGASSYTYDPFGQPVTATTGGVTQSDLYDGSALIQQAAGAKVANYISGGRDDTLQETLPSGAATPLTDRLGNVVALANSSGAITTGYTYSPGGAQTRTGASSANTLGFIGAPAGPVGLDQLGARYYSPAEDRFISQDPTGLAGGSPNLYQYAFDTPVNTSDPTGLSPDDSGGGCSSGASNGCGGDDQGGDNQGGNPGNDGNPPGDNPDNDNSPPDNNDCHAASLRLASFTANVANVGLAFVPEAKFASLLIGVAGQAADIGAGPTWTNMTVDTTGNLATIIDQGVLGAIAAGEGIIGELPDLGDDVSAAWNCSFANNGLPPQPYEVPVGDGLYVTDWTGFFNGQ